ncbi:thiamine pyrophosphate-requiring protein [Pseudomonas flexibilis]|uniref:Acetolactate synthase-1/2/3 large subunit n=1 Tax=Pseudomonas flexibilis TaxID=706570 RepID=A0A1N6R9F0_9PSED|nr:thiamine pyrophosphate-binding protein [Pseudomonas flexibilis]KHL68635.1 thiamine pyrophosphate-requiring protein [Pseudomonas flexibilis]SIQ25520.1 acetolactate synthase-1/2/3 large subunit [Pseudomonas flexibilis]
MKKTGAALARFALEQLGVRFTFGIPGVHNTELYDELNASEKIQPVLVTHECGAAFMADAVSRTSDSIGTLVIVPAAGVTHAASGIGEAGLDGIPMLIISGGIHSDSPYRYQLHDIDQHALLKPITKATFRIGSHAEVIPTLYEAYRIATGGEPGPVFVELPYNIGNFLGEVDEMPAFQQAIAAPQENAEALREAARLLVSAKRPGLFLGWGAVGAQAELVRLAELLDAPACTTLQGLSAFPGNHPLHVGMGFGDYAVPAAANAFAGCDCLLAVGTRFSEIPTGSYSMPVPDCLIHADINPEVFNANFPARVTLEGDAAQLIPALLREVETLQPAPRSGMAERIRADKAAYRDEWFKHDSQGRVNPARFFAELRSQLDDEAIVVADDGNHTFLIAELMPIHGPRRYLSPSDFNAMGYCIPATIGAKLANPDKTVVGVVGDGALRMTGLELLTASQLRLGVPLFVFNDGELSQIAQAQEIPYNRKTCTVLQPLNVKALAEATGAAFVAIDGNDGCAEGIRQALQLAAQNRPVLVDVRVDYSKRTRFTQGVVKATLKRFTPRDKVRVIGRALWRRVTG